MTAQPQRKLDLDQFLKPVSGTAEQRCRIAADFIPAGARVIGLGATPSALGRMLPNGCTFASCDYDGGEFPAAAVSDADVIAVLGVLEHVADVDILMAYLQRSARDVILSYSPSDLAVDGDAPAQGARNHFALYELAVLFDRFNFRIERSGPIDDREIIMKLKPARPVMPLSPCSVAVISHNHVGNFGDRLGYHMINALLPGEAEVHHLTFRTLEQAREKYDLVVVGIGNDIFQPLLGDDVLDVVKRGKSAVGIFGTQYRELIARPALDRLLDRLDTWYARYEDDVLMYGRGRNNVEHLGDWLIDQFPMSKGVDDEPIRIGDENWTDLPLDRTIQVIQRHKNVYSERLHPLLCALTSAELVAYGERPSKQMPDIMSGKFRSMLIDIFGRTYPEKKFFIVDRDAVIRYKAQVHRNVARVGERIAGILRNVASAAAA